MKRAFNFYISQRPGLGGLPMIIDRNGTTVWIRAERFESEDLLEALDAAEIKKDESVMNSHLVEVKG